ncbi:DUF362 domain-containing protein [Caldicellulosiruptoraceae bacterium PP1]
MSKVVLLECQDYDSDIIKEKLLYAFRLLNIDLNKFQSFLLKPNLLMKKKPEEATTTHPAVVKAIGSILMDLKKDVVLADSPGGPYTQRRLEGVYTASGLKNVCDELGIKLNYDISSSVLRYNKGVMLKNIDLIKPFFNSQALISLAKLKTHRMAIYTGAVKNLFGLIPGGKKAEMHFKYQEVDRFMDMLLDILEATRPILGIIDGIVAMEGEGPSAGNPKKLNVLIVSDDLLAADYIACKIIGLDIERVPLLRVAEDRGLLEVNNIEVIGDNIDHFIAKDFKIPDSSGISFLENRIPQPIKDALNNLMTPKPVFNRNHCIGCKECFNACPAQAIEMKERKAYVDLSKCIKCYCCHELCPAKAITIKRSFLFEKILK